MAKAWKECLTTRSLNSFATQRAGWSCSSRSPWCQWKCRTCCPGKAAPVLTDWTQRSSWLTPLEIPPNIQKYPHLQTALSLTLKICCQPTLTSVLRRPLMGGGHRPQSNKRLTKEGSQSPGAGMAQVVSYCMVISWFCHGYIHCRWLFAR